jgi:hypothetical protein
MRHYKQPSHKEVRDWLRARVASHKPPPGPDVIRAQLWHPDEHGRKTEFA